MSQAHIQVPPENGAASIGRRIASGARWTVGIRLGERLIGLASTLILARLLFPEDFGLVAMGTAVVGALQAVQSFGFEWAIIQRGTSERRYLDTAWTLNALFATGTGLVLCIVAPVAAALFDESRVVTVLYVLACSVAISGFRNIGMMLFEQRLDFGPIFIVAIVSKLSMFAASLATALAFKSYWALLAGILVSSTVDLCLTYVVSPYRPRFSLATVRELFSFSVWLMLNNLLFFLSNRGAEFVIGSKSGPSTLGTYNVAYEFSNLTTSELVAPLMRAAFPGYAKIKGRPDDMARLFLRIFGLVSLFAIPLGAGLASVAPVFIDVLLGPKWTSAAILVPPLALFGIVRALQGTTGSVYLALGKPHYLTAFAGIYVVLGVGTFALSLQWHSLEVATWTFVVATTVVAALNLSVIARELKISPKLVIAETFRPTIAAFAMTYVVNQASVLSTYTSTTSAAAVLLGLVTVGALTFGITLAILWRVAGDREAPEVVVWQMLRTGRLSSMNDSH